MCSSVCATTRGHFAPTAAETGGGRRRSAPTTTARCRRPSSSRTCPQPRESFVMIRGQYDKPGEKVEPATPAVLPPLKQAGERANRLDLAQLARRPGESADRPRHREPLLAAGLRHRPGEEQPRLRHPGTLPSHPELLDWLAVWFQENGWDVKRLMRADGHQPDLPPAEQRARRSLAERSRRTACSPAARASGSMPSRSATRRSSSAD